MYWIVWHYDKFLAPPWTAPLVNWTTRLLRLRSCLVRSFHLDSVRVRFSIRAFPSIPHFIISFFVIHTSSSFSESMSTPKTLQGCIHVAPVIWPILSLSSSPKPCWTWARAMYGSCSCALRRWREPRWLYLPVCLFSLPCHWVVFRQHFVFLARSSSFDLRHRPSNRPRFSLTASSCPILPVTFSHVLRKEGKHEENRRIRVERENIVRWW